MMGIDERAAEQGLIGKPMNAWSPTNASQSSLTNGDECGIIDNVREVPIASLAPGRRFELVLTATTPHPHKRLAGTLIRKGPGTVAVVLDDAEKQRQFTTLEGQVVTLKQAGGVVYWSPGTPVIDLKSTRDITRWTTKGGTGVGEDLHHPANFTQGDSAMSKTKERTAALPLPGRVKSKKEKAKAKRASAPKELHGCLCGCGEKVAGRFRQGHDGRYYSILKKVAAGEMKLNEMSRQMQADLPSVAAVKAALKASNH